MICSGSDVFWHWAQIYRCSSVVHKMCDILVDSSSGLRSRFSPNPGFGICDKQNFYYRENYFFFSFFFVSWLLPNLTYSLRMQERWLWWCWRPWSAGCCTCGATTWSSSTTGRPGPSSPSSSSSPWSPARCGTTSAPRPSSTRLRMEVPVHTVNRSLNSCYLQPMNSKKFLGLFLYIVIILLTCLLVDDLPLAPLGPLR